MTVKELKEQLDEMPDDASVYLQIVEPREIWTRKLEKAIFFPFDATVYLQYLY